MTSLRGCAMSSCSRAQLHRGEGRAGARAGAVRQRAMATVYKTGDVDLRSTSCSGSTGCERPRHPPVVSCATSSGVDNDLVAQTRGRARQVAPSRRRRWPPTSSPRQARRASCRRRPAARHAQGGRRAAVRGIVVGARGEGRRCWRRWRPRAPPTSAGARAAGRERRPGGRHRRRRRRRRRTGRVASCGRSPGRSRRRFGWRIHPDLPHAQVPHRHRHRRRATARAIHAADSGTVIYRSPDERLRQRHRHRPRRRALDALRAQSGFAVTGGACQTGPGDRLRRHDRLRDRPAPALRGARGRPPGRPDGLPALSRPPEFDRSTPA